MISFDQLKHSAGLSMNAAACRCWLPCGVADHLLHCLLWLALVQTARVPKFGVADCGRCRMHGFARDRGTDDCCVPPTGLGGRGGSASSSGCRHLTKNLPLGWFIL